MNNLHRILKYIHYYIPPERKLCYAHFIDNETRDSYAKNGYAIIRNIVTNELIEIIKCTYEKLTKSEKFHESESFITSANYSKELQACVHESLKDVNKILLPKIFNTDAIHSDILNLLVLKYSNKPEPLLPHLDVSLVDEFMAPTTYLWVPTEYVDKLNGTLMVLPGSHHWATWQRTHDQYASPIKSHLKPLLKKMTPITLNKGDLIIFDSSLIHASVANTSKNVRIAMNTGVVPKGFDLVHYQRLNNKKIEKYIIDINFWEEGHYTNPNSVPDKYQPAKIEDLRCPFQLSMNNINFLIKKYANTKQ